MVRSPSGLALLWLAATAGGVHTASSLYWAAGGTWLLETVGEGVVELHRDNRPLATAILLAAALVKGSGAVAPLWAEYQGGPQWRRIIRATAWVVGVILVLYGITIATVSTAVLTGAVTPEGEVDRTGHAGHALLWNPLFAAWGALLLAGLWRTRQDPARHRGDDGSAPTDASSF